MNHSHFTFPPPPPPPPTASNSYTAYPQASSGQRGHVDRGRGGSRGHDSRGRGYSRGGSRGGQGRGNTPGYGGFPPANDRGTNSHSQINGFGNSHPPPYYSSVHQPQYPTTVNDAYSHKPPHFPEPAPFSNPAPLYSGHPPNGQHTATTYDGQRPRTHHSRVSPAPYMQDSGPAHPHGPMNQPFVMPPIRVGRDGRGGILHTQASHNPPASYNLGPPVSNAFQAPIPNSFHQPQHESQHQFHGGRGRDLYLGNPDHCQQTRTARLAGQVGPAVPSFGNPLPDNLPSRPPFNPMPGDNVRRPKRKKRRRHNQLGLTPKTEEHESSEEEEDDQDEESKLGAAVGATSQQYELPPIFVAIY